MNKVQKAILKTLAFFDIFSRPLTLEELWRFLYRTQASRFQVLVNVQKLQKKGKISQKDDYYCLKGREAIFRDFGERKLICLARWQKVKWVVRILQSVPFVKNISIINSLSFGASRKDSDIDILIITQKNRLWTARALTIALLEILGQNKNQWYQADKFCLGFAFDETRLNLKMLRLKNDIYFSYWLANLTPVMGGRMYERLIKENAWLFEELPNWQEKSEVIWPELKKKRFFEKILAGEWGDKLEKWLANIQIKRIWRDKKNKRPGASVVAAADMLKLHPYDKRLMYREKWEGKVAVLTRNTFLR